MTLHTMGDSHCDVTFTGIPNVSVHRIGPVTLRRVSHPDDTLLPNAVATLNLAPNNTLLLCFGEIDVRCWIQPSLARRKDGNLHNMLAEWAKAYLDRIQTLPTQAKIAVLGITPPAPMIRIVQSTEFTVRGSDQERILWTTALNTTLAKECAQRNIPLVDLSPIAGPGGMLPLNRSDGQHHALCPTLVSEALAKAGIPA